MRSRAISTPPQKISKSRDQTTTRQPDTHGHSCSRRRQGHSRPPGPTPPGGSRLGASRRRPEPRSVTNACRPLHQHGVSPAKPRGSPHRATARAAAAAAAAAATPVVRTVVPVPLAGSATSAVVPASAEPHPSAAAKGLDRAEEARIRAMRAAAHPLGRRGGSRRHRPVGGGGGGATPRRKHRSQLLPRHGSSRDDQPRTSRSS